MRNSTLGILSKISEHIGVAAIHSVLAAIRESHDDSRAGYGETADFELAAARICHDAGAASEAAESWRRACQFLSSYGGHKDPTLSELTDSIHDIADVDLNLARDGLAKLVDLVYLVSQHTDGRDTSHYADRWWECAADIDPIAAALDGANILVHSVGLEDFRVQTAHSRLLAHQTATGDPIALAALRLTAGISWRQPSADTELLVRLTGELGTSPQANAMLAVVANTVAASYDDQSMMYSSSQPSTVTTADLVDAVVALGGSSFPARVPHSEPNRNSPYDAGARSDPLELQRRIVSAQRPVVPAGRAGVLLAARDRQDKQYSDDETAPRWDLDALANTIGWRIIEATVNQGADAGIDLIEDVAREVATYSDNEIFAALGEGLALRAVVDMPEEMKKVAAYTLTRAYIRIRGGGGWRTFAGRDRADLWSKAHAIDPTTAEATLAAAVVETVASDAQRSYGVTQAVVAAFSATPATTPGGTATECWTAAFSIIVHRLPGQARRFGHTYRPTPTPNTSEELDVAMATLAVAAIAQPMRSDLRQSLLAAALLLTCRPDLGQAAIANTLAGNLDAGRGTWLLDVVRSCLPAGRLSDDLAAVLTNLASVDILSVRALAASILSVHERPLPNPPATEPAPPIRAAFHALMKERG